MRSKDLCLLMFVCFIWALNVVVGKLVLSGMQVPPFYYAGIRFVLVALVLSPLLWPLPRPFGPIVAIGFLMGASHFGLLFLGLTASTPSSAAIVLQLGIPLTTLLSVLFLGERMSPLRVVGMLVALLGVLVVIWNPAEARFSVGLIAVAGSAAALACGSILLKRFGPIRPLRLQAWVSSVSALPLAAASALLEQHQWTASLAGGWAFWAALAFSVLVVTIWAHTAYFSILQRYEANLIVPLTLAMPIMTMFLGLTITGDHIDMRTLIGTAAALVGVAIVLKAPAGTTRKAIAAAD